jgi:membrane protein DedA with SNARE-associated domain
VAAALTLFTAALLHEDVAILTAAFFASQNTLPVGALYAIVYAGILLNNSALYALGIAARRIPRLRRWLIGERVEQLRQQLEQKLPCKLALCRFIPGVLTPTLLGCGWLGIPLPRFLCAAALAATCYVLLILTLAITLGETLLQENKWLLPTVTAVALAWKWLHSRRSG